MAKFEPTEAEKAAASYLEWDDAELGKFTKYIALQLAALEKADKEGLRRVSAASIGMMLIGCCIDTNATKLKVDFTGLTHKDKPSGDWTIEVRQKAPARVEKDLENEKRHT